MEKNTKKCNQNCQTCQFHNEDDSCSETGEQNCSQKTNFSKCENYLVADKLVHF